MSAAFTTVYRTNKKGEVPLEAGGGPRDILRSQEKQRTNHPHGGSAKKPYDLIVSLVLLCSMASADACCVEATNIPTEAVISRMVERIMARM